MRLIIPHDQAMALICREGTSSNELQKRDLEFYIHVAVHRDKLRN